MSDTITDIINRIKPLDRAAMTAARSRQKSLTKPEGSLGRLEEISVQLAGVQAVSIPKVREKAIIVMAADHGVVAEKVGNWPQEVTTQMVMNFLSGGAAINVLARHVGARVVIVDIGVAGELPALPGLISCKVDRGTRNMVSGPVMTPIQAVQSIETGIEIINHEIKKGLDIVGTGDMGIGNTTSSSAILAVMSGLPVKEVTGRGTGIDDAQLDHKIKVIERAIGINRPNPDNPIDVLQKVGGFEIGGLVGVILGAAANRIPVVIDGFISGAAAMLAIALAPASKDYIIASHLSAERGHRLMLEYLGLKPLFDLDMRLGEGTGAALGISLCEASVKLISEMATFDQAGVSKKNIEAGGDL